MLLCGMAAGSLLWHAGKVFIKRGLKSTFHNSGFAGAKGRLQSGEVFLTLIIICKAVCEALPVVTKRNDAC